MDFIEELRNLSTNIAKQNTTEYTPLYVAERCYVYNNRHLDTIFCRFINDSMKLLSKDG